MNTNPPTNAPTQQWSTKSKKRFIFGFILIIASIGIEPACQSVPLLPPIFIVLGTVIAWAGYWLD